MQRIDSKDTDMSGKLLTPETTMFESVYCSRCAGSGRYSFNLMHGHTCYGCGGKGVTLTKRGAAAQKYLKQISSKPARELRVGDVVKFDMCFFVCWSPIEKIEVSDSGNIMLTTTRAKTGETIQVSGISPDSMIELRFVGEQRAALVKQAKAYQATLTKDGVPAQP